MNSKKWIALMMAFVMLFAGVCGACAEQYLLEDPNEPELDYSAETDDSWMNAEAAPSSTARVLAASAASAT